MSALDDLSYSNTENWGRKINHNEILTKYSQLFTKSFGIFFIAKCPICKRMQPGPLSLCICCSVERNEPVPLFTCTNSSCWCNPDKPDRESFDPDQHLWYVCPHNPDLSKENIYEVRSCIECVASVTYMSPKPLYDTYRTEQVGHAVHCKNTNQAAWLTSINNTSCLYHQGEILTAEIIFDFQKDIDKQRRTTPLPQTEARVAEVSFTTIGINSMISLISRQPR